MQVTIIYDPHNADDLAKLAEMFSGSPAIFEEDAGHETAKAGFLNALAEHKERTLDKAAEPKAAKLSDETIVLLEELEAHEEKGTLGQEEDEQTDAFTLDLEAVKKLAIEAIKAGKRDEVLAKLKELGSPTVTKLPAKHFDVMYDFLTDLMGEA